MLWLFWIATIFAVIGTQIYTTRTIIRMRFKLESLQKRAAKIKMDEKIAQGNLGIAKRELLEINNRIRNQAEAIEKTIQAVNAFEENRKKKSEESKKRLFH